jgi:hypothetical protein
VNDLLVLNSLYYILVIVLFGLPIWLFTTTTYRASLPFEEIDHISSMKTLTAQINFEMAFPTNVPLASRQNLEQQLLKQLYTGILDLILKKTGYLISEFIYNLYKKDLDQEYGLVLDFKITTRVFSQSEIDSFTILNDFNG